jgi:FlaA1/EpsC-like NDP-sugar epimerase
VRELLANPSRDLQPIGFIDDDRAKRGRDVLGVPILGSGSDLLELVMLHGVTVLVIASRGLDAATRSRIERVQANAGLEVWQFQCEFVRFGDTPPPGTFLASSVVANRLAPMRSAGPAEPAS